MCKPPSPPPTSCDGDLPCRYFWRCFVSFLYLVFTRFFLVVSFRFVVIFFLSAQKSITPLHQIHARLCVCAYVRVYMVRACGAPVRAYGCGFVYVRGLLFVLWSGGPFGRVIPILADLLQSSGLPTFVDSFPTSRPRCPVVFLCFRRYSRSRLHSLVCRRH